MRDESAEDVRLIFEPRSRSVDPALMMESLFKLTELESRVQLNMNVLLRGRIPKVVGLAEALNEWLTHRRDVLLRRSRYRLGQIEHRLEVLGGYLVAYLNIDKVIKIVRKEDEPKPVLMSTFKLSDVQADAILNMRLRNLRRLEEIEIREEEKTLRAEKRGIEDLLRSEKEQWKVIAREIREVRDKFGPKTPLGKRRTGFAEAPAHDEAAIEEALVEREPVTIVVSEKGWIRALRGQVADLSNLAFKADDGLKLAFFAETTSKLLVFATNGRCYTIDAAKLPGGRGHGEPMRLLVELGDDQFVSGRQYLARDIHHCVRELRGHQDAGRHGSSPGLQMRNLLLWSADKGCPRRQQQRAKLQIPVGAGIGRHRFRGAFFLRRPLDLVEGADERVVADRNALTGIDHAGLRRPRIDGIGFECRAADEQRERCDRVGDLHRDAASACSRKAAQPISRASSLLRPTS